MTTLYENLNNMPDSELRAGSDKVLTFVCYQEDGVNLLNLTGGSYYWRICRYGDFTTKVLEIIGQLDMIDSSKFTVTITPSDTESLSGKYIQQIIVTDFDGHEFVPGQGILVIFPKISD